MEPDLSNWGQNGVWIRIYNSRFFPEAKANFASGIIRRFKILGIEEFQNFSNDFTHGGRVAGHGVQAHFATVSRFASSFAISIFISLNSGRKLSAQSLTAYTSKISPRISLLYEEGFSYPFKHKIEPRMAT